MQLTSEDLANMIRLARRAPLMNMEEAENVAQLLQKFAAFAAAYLEEETKKKTEEAKKANGHDGDAKDKQLTGQGAGA